jgi:hypothetical protein
VLSKKSKMGKQIKTHRPVSESELLNLFKAEVKKIAACDADDTLLEYMASVAIEILSEDGDDVGERLLESLGGFMSSFLDDAQATAFIANILCEIKIPGQNSKGNSAEKKIEPESKPVDLKANSAAAETYKPKWIEPSKKSTPEANKAALVPAKSMETADAPKSREVVPPAAPIQHVLLTKAGDGGGAETDLCDTVFSMAFGGRTLLARTRLHLQKGRRYGLVGANGAGIWICENAFPFCMPISNLKIKLYICLYKHTHTRKINTAS